MQEAHYYRSEAGRARRLSRHINDPDMLVTLARMAKNYDDIAADLENGAVEVKHPERMPQR